MPALQQLLPSGIFACRATFLPTGHRLPFVQGDLETYEQERAGHLQPALSPQVCADWQVWLRDRPSEPSTTDAQSRPDHDRDRPGNRASGPLNGRALSDDQATRRGPRECEPKEEGQNSP